MNEEITLSLKIYNLEAILNACYVFIDRAYIFLDSVSKGDQIKVFIKGKKRLTQKQLEVLKGEFTNELLHSALRCQISKNNKKIREYIIGRALYSTLPPADLVTTDEKLDYQEDPLGIAIPWEEKYGTVKRRVRDKNEKAKDKKI